MVSLLVVVHEELVKTYSAKVQEWLGHINITTSRIYDHRKTRPEDSPTFKVNYLIQYYRIG